MFDIINMCFINLLLYLFSTLIRKLRTFTAPVKLNKCLIAIKDNAFSASAYPVILTFEDHLPQELQTKVAQVNINLENVDVTILFT